MQRLVTIIRQDLIPGYQIAQSIHSAVEYALYHKKDTLLWHNQSNYVLVLGTSDLLSLLTLELKLKRRDIEYTLFFEPDIQEYTSISFLSTEETDKITNDLPLAGSVSGTVDMNYKEAQ